MIIDIKKNADGFLKKNKISVADYASLKNAAMRLGYTVIEFNNILNDDDVETVIENLKIGEAALKSRGFTYSDANYRLIFVHEDLTEDEKLLVIAHELGHVVCEHYSFGPIIGKDVKEEHEANEFAHYILKQNKFRKCKRFVSEHKKAIVCFSIALALCVATVFVLHFKEKEKTYYGEFYITETGDKYHQMDCIHVKNNVSRTRLTVEQFNSGEYAPCGICLPQG